MTTPAFVADFFPTSTALLRRHAPSTWDALFQHSQQHCPPQVWQPTLAGAPAIYSPSLLPLAVLGAVVGLRAAAQTAGKPKQTVWQRAFLCFAAMNLSAVACHSLLTPGSAAHALARALDVAFTGAASTCFLLASLWRGAAAAAIRKRDAQLQYWLASGTSLCVLANCLPSGRWPLVNELAYIATTLAAVAVLAVREMACPGLSRSQRLWVVAAGASAAIGAQGALLDGVLCTLAGPRFSGAHLLFLGCDAAVFALGQYLRLGGADGMPASAKAGARAAAATPARQQPPRRARAAAGAKHA